MMISKAGANRRYRVETNGMAGNCHYWAPDPDEACTCATRHENFLRLLQEVPSMKPDAVHRRAVRCGPPEGFRITCVREELP